MTDDGLKDAEQAALEKRLENLGAALRRVDEEKASAQSLPPARKGFTHAMRVGLNAVSEFIGAVLVGCFVGWQVDTWLGTAPWVMILLLGFGVAAGFYNVYRVAKPKGLSGDGNLDQDA